MQPDSLGREGMATRTAFLVRSPLILQKLLSVMCLLVRTEAHTEAKTATLEGTSPVNG
jgi:hypothetical protein